MPGDQKPVVNYRDLVNGIRQLGVTGRPAIAHVSLSAFGMVRGGADTLLGALLSGVSGLMMPAFTYTTMLIPEDGPDANASDYGSGRDTNRMAEFFKENLPADSLMGVVAEALRRRPDALRSMHPILSFAGVQVEEALKAQTYADPLAPIRVLARQGASVILMGVDHTVNTSIHYAERLSGRRQFIRWALTPDGVRECPGFPGCSDGFQAVESLLAGLTRTVSIGGAQVSAFALVDLIDEVQQLLKRDPLALLCDRLECPRCDAVRADVRRAGMS